MKHNLAYNKFYCLFKKDTALFFSSLISLASTFGFAFLCVVVATFTLGALILPERVVLALTASWLCFIFATIHVFSKSLEAERSDEALDMILLSRVSPATFFFAKWLASTLVVWLIQLFICLLFEVFFAADLLANFTSLALVFLLSASAISALGILFSALSSYLQNREISFPIMIFPLSIPILFSGVELSIKVCLNQGLDFFWLTVLLSINAISLSLSWLLFERVLRG